MALIETYLDRSNFVPLEELITLKEFTGLNVKKQRFLIAYCGAGLTTGTYDAVAAVHFAYGDNIKHPEIRGHQLLANRNVRNVLNLHFRRTELEILLSDLQRATQKSLRLKMLTPATVKALLAFEEYVEEQKSIGQEKSNG